MICRKNSTEVLINSDFCKLIKIPHVTKTLNFFLDVQNDLVNI